MLVVVWYLDLVAVCVCLKMARASGGFQWQQRVRIWLQSNSYLSKIGIIVVIIILFFGPVIRSTKVRGRWPQSHAELESAQAIGFDFTLLAHLIEHRHKSGERPVQADLFLIRKNKSLPVLTVCWARAAASAADRGELVRPLCNSQDAELAIEMASLITSPQEEVGAQASLLCFDVSPNELTANAC